MAMRRLATRSPEYGGILLSSLYQTGTFTAFYGSAWCRAGMPSVTPSKSQRNLSLRAKARQRGRTRSSPHDRSSHQGLVLSKQRPVPFSQRGGSSFARVSEIRLRNWLKFYNAFRGRKSHIRLSVFMQGTSRRHHRQRHTSGSKDGYTASSSQHHNAKRVKITGDERRIYRQITKILEGVMFRIQARAKRDFLKKQRDLVSMELSKALCKSDASKKAYDNRKDLKKGVRNEQPSKKQPRRRLAMFIPEKKRKELMTAPEVAAESRDILKLFDKLISQPSSRLVRDGQTGKKVRKPLVSNDRAKVIISDLQSSRYMEGALKNSFNDLDVH